MKRTTLISAAVVVAWLWAAIGFAADAGKEAMVMPCDTGGNLHLTNRSEPPACVGRECRVDLARNDDQIRTEKAALRVICMDDCEK